MSIVVKNNIDPIVVKSQLRAAIKITNEGASKKAMEQALKCFKAYDNAIQGYQSLNAKALARITELAQQVRELKGVRL